MVNISKAAVDPLTFHFLKRGLNFAPSPQTIPHINFLADIENALHTLPTTIAKKVRQDCVVALRRSKPLKCNIPKVKIKAFKNFILNHDLIISKPDKGNPTVIMEKSDYTSNMLDLLSHTNRYRVVPHNPCTKIAKKVKSAIGSSSFLF